MPTLNINGTRINVGDDFLKLSPEEQNATVDEISASLPKAAAPSSEGSSFGGVAKSAGVGLAKGAIGLAGLPGDLYHLGLRAMGDKLTPESSIGSAAIQRGVEGVTGEFYKPKGFAENLAQTAGEFVPALIGGPETIGTKLATRVAAPALASEAAGAMTGGDPLAKTGAALLAAAASPWAANRINALRAGATAVEPPSVQQLKAASRLDYQHPDVTSVRLAPQATNNLADTIAADLQFGPNSGFRPTNSAHAPVFNELENLRSVPPQGAAAGPMPKTVADLDNVRQALGRIAKERDLQGNPTAAAEAARRAIGHIDNFLPNLNQADLLAGNASRANTILERARANWAAAKRAQEVQRIAANAEINAAASHSGANIQNATKQAFKPLLKNGAGKAVGYTADELAALNGIVRGTFGSNAARFAGNLLGGGGGLGMLASGAVGYEQGGVPGAIAAGLAGRGLKRIGDRSTLNAVARLDRMLRSRSPEAIRMAAQNPQIAAQLPPAAMRRLQAMITADPLISQAAQPVNASGQY